MKDKFIFRKSGMFVLITVVLVIVMIHVIDYLKIAPIVRKSRLSYINEQIDKLPSSMQWKMSSYFDNVYQNLISGLNLHDTTEVRQLCETITNLNDDIIAVNINYCSDNTISILNYNPFAKEKFQLIKSEDKKSIINPNAPLSPKEFLDKENDYCSEPTISTACNNSRIVTVTYPFHNSNGIVDAMFQLSFSIDSLSSDINLVNPYPNGKIYILSRVGNFSFHPDSAMITKPAKKWLIEHYGSNILGVLEQVNKNNNHSLLYSHIEYNKDRDTLIYVAKEYQGNNTILYIAPCLDMVMDLIDINLIIFVVAILGIAVIVYVCLLSIKHSAKIHAKKVLMEKELTTAAEIQASILSKPLISNPAIDIDAILIPAKIVGGDLYYYLEQDDKLYFCIGDVAGKGVPASIFMSRVVTLIRSKQHDNTPSEFTEQINKELCISNTQMLFVTMFFGELDLKTGKLSYCNAGHELPVICDNENYPYFLNVKTNIPLGIDENFKYEEETIMLKNNCTLVMYTDGVTEATNSLNLLYGNDRILKNLSRTLDKTSAEINSEMINDIHKFVAQNEQSDDITLLTIKFSKC